MSVMEEVPLSIRMFGTFEVRCASATPQRLPPQRAPQLLALLVLHCRQHADCVVSRAELAGTLWRESDPALARNNLRQAVLQLQPILGPEKSRLTAKRHTLRLNLTGADVDLVAFDQARKRDDTDALKRAIALYHGPLLEGWPDESWILGERAARHNAYMRALDTLAQRALEDGARDEAIRYLEMAVSCDPARQSNHRLLMQILAEQQDYAAVRQVYQTLRERLHRERNEKPDPASTQLYVELLENPHHHRYRQTTDVDNNTAASQPPCRVPLPITPLLGREREMSTIQARLMSAHLVSLTGMGGIGKTRLAIQAALESVEHFLDGVWWVELESLRNQDLIPQRIAAALGIAAGQNSCWDEIVIGYLRSKHLLLVLDNAEHLLEGCARIIRSILRACSHVHLLVTTRERLGLTGEVVCPVPPLALPGREALFDPETLSLYPAVRLFLDRAAAVRSDFTIGPENVESLVDLCHALEGVPLAIELAAARLEGLSLDEILHRLIDRFPELTNRDPTAPMRQQSLLALIDWSCRLLEEPQRILLRRLCVFAGGWTGEAAESVCASESLSQYDVERSLARLVASSLVVAQERGGRMRYRLLEMVRQYALRQSDAAETQRVRGRHYAYFLRLAETAEPELTGPQQAIWLERLELEYDNLRAALDWCLSSTAPTGAGLRLAGLLARFWYAYGYLDEGLGWLDRVLKEQAVDPSNARQYAIRWAGNLAYARGDYGRAEKWYDEWLRIACEGGDRGEIAAAQGSLANIANAREDYMRAQELLMDSLQHFSALGDRRGIALSQAVLATTARNTGDYVHARRLHEESLEVLRELGDHQNIALACHNLSDILLHLGDLAAVPPLLVEGLELSLKLGNRRFLAHGLTNHITLAVKQGEMERAAILQGAEQTLRQQIGFPLPPTAFTEHEKEVQEARHRLGDAVYEQHHHDGRAMALEDVIAFLRRISSATGVE